MKKKLKYHSIKELDYADKYSKSEAFKIYSNQYEMAEKINEIIRILNTN